MNGYKGYEKGLICRGKQYEIGKVFEEEKAEVNECGMHFCVLPHQVFKYYSAGSKNEFTEVVSQDWESTFDELLYSTKKLKIGKRISAFDICKISVKKFFEWCNFDKKIEGVGAGNSGQESCGAYGAVNVGHFGAAVTGYTGVANAGDYGAVIAGDYGAANAGNYGSANAGIYGAANAGYYGTANVGRGGAANAGDYGSVNAGNYGAANVGSHGAVNVGNGGAASAGSYGVANAGDYGAANAGNYGSAKAGVYGFANSGNHGVSCAGKYGEAKSGDFGVSIVSEKGIASIGRKGVAVCYGARAKAKGALGSVLVFLRTDSKNAVFSQTVNIDGVNYIPGTLYMMNKKGVVVKA